MPKCPNCGQKTERTEDWGCPWCGYPLLSGSYKKIPKTYRQLQEEKLPERKPAVIEELETVPETEPVVEPEPVPEPEPVLEAELEPVTKPKPKPVAKPKRKPATKSKATTAPKPRRKPVPMPEPEPEPVTEAEPLLKSEPAPAEIELTVEELLSVYQREGGAADTQFANKILKLTGVVARIEVKNVLDIYYINLTSAERNLLQNVRCVFDRQHGHQLMQLSTGQTVTVQGKYDGTIMDIRLSDCILVG